LWEYNLKDIGRFVHGLSRTVACGFRRRDRYTMNLSACGGDVGEWIGAVLMPRVRVISQDWLADILTKRYGT